MFSDLGKKFAFDFLEKERWRYITDGLKITIIVTILSLILGVIIGLVVAVIRTIHDQTKEEGKPSAGRVLLTIGDVICRIYLTVIRGTPQLVQLLLMYFVFMINSSKLTVAVVAFGINSGAYVAEIFRSGILSIDKGQMEAGRSLGLSYGATMKLIILPQAIKNVLPALVNEMITLLKETSICGYIGLNELTRGGDIIRGITFDAFVPLMVVAAIYLCLVMLITFFMGRLERRLRKSDIR